MRTRPNFTDMLRCIRPGRLAICPALLLVVLLALAPQALAEDERTAPEDRVIRLTLPVAGKPTAGTIVSYTPLTFTLETEAGKQHRFLWNAIPAPNVDRYWRFLEKPEGDADALFELGDLLIRHRDGEKLAEQAFAQALKLDPTLSDAIKRSRAGKAPDGTPRYVGTADKKQWGKLTDEQTQDGIKALHHFAKRTQTELRKDLRLYESARYMVLTDVDVKTVQALLPKLNQAYTELSKLLGEDPRGNLFLGKCMIVLFQKRVDYIRFQSQLHKTDARGTRGMCHGFGNGHVHVAAFDQGQQRKTNHLIVHELVHAYLHRYRSPVPVDDWINEGLADTIAHRVEPPPKQNIYIKAKLLLEGRDGLGEGFFDPEGLQAWQYPIAHAMTGYLMTRGKHAYPLFIQAIKAGTPTEKALEKVYRTPPKVLTQRFLRKLDIEMNKKFGG